MFKRQQGVGLDLLDGIWGGSAGCWAALGGAEEGERTFEGLDDFEVCGGAGGVSGGMVGWDGGGKGGEGRDVRD